MKSLLGVGNYANLEIEVLAIFGIEPPFDAAEFDKGDRKVLSEKLYEAVLNVYQQNKKEIIDAVLPAVQEIQAQNPDKVIDINIPITDQKKVLEMSIDLQTIIATKGASIVQNIEKINSLLCIDQERKNRFAIWTTSNSRSETQSGSRKTHL